MHNPYIKEISLPRRDLSILQNAELSGLDSWRPVRRQDRTSGLAIKPSCPRKTGSAALLYTAGSILLLQILARKILIYAIRRDCPRGGTRRDALPVLKPTYSICCILADFLSVPRRGEPLTTSLLSCACTYIVLYSHTASCLPDIYRYFSLLSHVLTSCLPATNTARC